MMLWVTEKICRILFIISTPTDTPFMSSIGVGTATFTKHEWQTDTLASPASNAQIEGDDSPSVLHYLLLLVFSTIHRFHTNLLWSQEHKKQ